MFRITIVAGALALTACASTPDTQTAQQPRQEQGIPRRQQHPGARSRVVVAHDDRQSVGPEPAQSGSRAGAVTTPRTAARGPPAAPLHRQSALFVPARDAFAGVFAEVRMPGPARNLAPSAARTRASARLLRAAWAAACRSRTRTDTPTRASGGRQSTAHCRSGCRSAGAPVTAACAARPARRCARGTSPRASRPAPAASTLRP